MKHDLFLYVAFLLLSVTPMLLLVAFLDHLWALVFREDLNSKETLQTSWLRWAIWIQPKLVQTASELGLELKGYRFTSFEMEGRRGPLEIALHCSMGRSVVAQIHQPDIPTSLKLAARRPQETREVPTGDESFDDGVTVGGDAAIVSALLDVETRKRVREMVALGVEVDNSFVKAQRTCLGMGPRKLVREGAEAIETALGFAHLLSIQGPEIPGRLARNAANDPLPAVRELCLRTLGSFYPAHQECLRQHQASLEEESPGMRLLAAAFLIQSPGIDSERLAAAARVLVEIARTNVLSEETRVRAIEGLASPPGAADTVRVLAEPLIEELLAQGRGAPLVAAIGTLAKLNLRSHIPRLAELTTNADFPVNLAIAKAMGELGGPQAQEVLLLLVETLVELKEKKIVSHAAEALGEVGDAQAVEPLLRLSREHRGRALGDTALEAARRIQGRLVGGEAGQLSLAATAELEGALSGWELAAGPGDLSMAEAAPPVPAVPRRVAEGS